MSNCPRCHAAETHRYRLADELVVEYDCGSRNEVSTPECRLSAVLRLLKRCEGDVPKEAKDYAIAVAEGKNA